jgi:hypothetical protein
VVKDPLESKPTPKGKQRNPFSLNTPTFVTPNVPFNVAASKKDKKDDAEHDKGVVKDVYQSDEFNQCQKRKKVKNVDKHLDEVWKSCRDLEIDG